MRRTVVVGTALTALACGGIGRRSSPGGYMLSGDLLEISQWCEPRALFISTGNNNLAGCLPPGVAAGAARIELVPGRAPRVLAEVGTGFGACAAARLDLELVLYEHSKGYPMEAPIPADARCEAIYAWPTTAHDEAWAAAGQLLPPENAADRVWERIGDIIAPEGHF